MAELDGRPVTVDELQVLALTNYGAYTTLRVEDGRVRGLGPQLDRLVRDARVLFGAELDRERVRGLLRRMVPAVGATTLRATVFDPATDLGRPDRARDPHVLVTRRAAGPRSLPPLSVRSAVHRRELPGVKGVGLFGALHHRRAAQLAGYDDVLFVDAEGAVSEGGTWNIGFFDGDGVLWPDADALPGVTMGLLQRAHPYRTARVRLADIGGMRAAFATNAVIGYGPSRGWTTSRCPSTTRSWTPCARRTRGYRPTWCDPGRPGPRRSTRGGPEASRPTRVWRHLRGPLSV